MFTSRCTKSIARKVNRASHGPGVLAKGRVRRTPKVNPKVPKVPKVRTRVKRQTLVDPVLKTLKSETNSETRESAQTYHTDNCCTGGSWFDDGWSFDQGSLDLGAMSSPKRFEWVKMTLDTELQ